MNGVFLRKTKNFGGIYLLLSVVCIYLLLVKSASAQSAYVSIVLDPTFHTPAPPNDSFPPNPVHILHATIGMLAIAVLATIVAVFDGFKYKSTVPVAIVTAAAFCVFPESIDNYLGGCYWSQLHIPSHIFYFLMGREFDYYVIVMWWAFGAVLGYVMYAALLRNAATRTLWLAFAISGVADILFEETLLGYGGIYTYFGHQPLVLISRFPWWWLFVNVSALFLSVAVAYRFRDWLNGWRSVLILALMPVCYIGGFAFAGMPAIFVIQGNFSAFLTEAAGIATVILSLVLTSGVMSLVLGRTPFGLRGEEPECRILDAHH